MFEIKALDAMGRVGRFSIKEHVVETPLFLPVINPNLYALGPDEIKAIGFDAVITNAYIIYRSEGLREEALSKGVNGLLGFDGPVMTDSGSYQLSQYNEVEIGPDEIVRFQREIASDIGVILDIPTPPDTGHEKAKRDLEETIRRAKNVISVKGDMLLAGTVQGGTHMDLREESAKAMAELDFDVYPIGGVVPLMETYRFADLVKIIIHSKRYLPPDKPVHLFGAGHPMMFALAVSLGCDIFDSAAYSLYAQDGRYITPTGTLRLKEMRTLPCACPVCAGTNPDELRAADDRTTLLATHNLNVTHREINLVKEAIHRGALWELVERRCRSHPYLLDALRILKGYPLERYEPLSKASAFFYSGPESLHRPEVKRHKIRLGQLETSAKNLVLIPMKKGGPSKSDVGSNTEYHICFVSPVFGVIPTEIEEVYPLSQHIFPEVLDESQITMMKKAVEEYAKGFEKIQVSRELEFLGLEGEVIDRAAIERDTLVKLRALGDYQFGRGAGAALFSGCAGVYARTGRLRHIYSGETLVATIRASDGIIVPALEGAKRLLTLPQPRNRVVVEDEEVCGYIREGKSVFAKFVTACDPEIVAGSEVIVVDSDDDLVNWGRSVLDARELLAFKVGVGVKTRGNLEK